MKTLKRRMVTMMMMAMTSLLAGCGNDGMEQAEKNSTFQAGQSEAVDETAADVADQAENNSEETENTETEERELIVQFGDEGTPFVMYMEDNQTAQAIVRYVGTTDWRLPIYDWDSDVDYSVMEYYDIPSRYEIPSDPETVTEAKAGEVFYSDPNRIVLFYKDAQITEEYTKIGTFDATEEFVSAVENNPVLEGWGNKIIHISQP